MISDKISPRRKQLSIFKLHRYSLVDTETLRRLALTLCADRPGAWLSGADGHCKSFLWSPITMSESIHSGCTHSSVVNCRGFWLYVFCLPHCLKTHRRLITLNSWNTSTPPISPLSGMRRSWGFSLKPGVPQCWGTGQGPQSCGFKGTFGRKRMHCEITEGDFIWGKAFCFLPK